MPRLSTAPRCRRLFHVSYTVEGTWRLLRRHDWSWQQPTRRVALPAPGPSLPPHTAWSVRRGDRPGEPAPHPAPPREAPRPSPCGPHGCGAGAVVRGATGQER
ncbi:winged helix-turn-helix domain-containing protein [Streptomyces pratensis]|uniref:helix-turn-helix domain-containing protein n=1 Tax=Streptomyces pratensis TaxID=1169025 RepID=UPI0036308734